MFERKTIFVIEAGASKELGLPTGGELKGKIAEKLDNLLYHEFLNQYWKPILLG